MRKNDWVLVCITLIYSFLFYKQAVGLNFCVFTLIIITGLLLKNRDLVRRTNWRMVMLGSLVSSISVVKYGNELAMLTNFISLLLLVGISMSEKSSVFFSLLHGAFSLICSPVFYFMNLSERIKNREDEPTTNRKWLLVLIPILITLLFFFIYRSSNSVFAAFTNKINFQWISFGWIVFTLFGLIFLYGFLNPNKVDEIAHIDEVDELNLHKKEEKEWKLFGRTIAIKDEYFSGIVMFISINLLIGIVNLLDIHFIFIDSSLPKGMTYSQFLHQGVGMLVLSIAISILIILFYFRGELNFFEKNRTFKTLAYIWMIQNMLMLISVCMKNNLYIENYGLTYKRIGIYIYSVLSLAGLFTTLLKIYKIKINLYLVRLNGWIFYAALLICSLINWDSLIVDFTRMNMKSYDRHYLMSLSDSTIPSLIKLEHKIENQDERQEYDRFLKNKINHFEEIYRRKSWKAWNYQDFKVEKAIEVMKY